ncbi:MAG TPA: hypothetical protein VGA20_07235 [Gemmatimonadales bacterium]
MFDSPVIPMTVFFLSVAAIFILRGPFGKALADRWIRRAPEEPDVHDLRADVEELRQQLTEMQERLDFAERLVARQQGPALPRSGV